MKESSVISKEAMELLEIYLSKTGLENNEAVNKSLEKPFKMVISLSQEFPNKIQVGVEFADELNINITKDTFINIDINELKNENLANTFEKLADTSKNNTFNENCDYKSDCQSNNVILTENASLLHANNAICNLHLKSDICLDNSQKENLKLINLSLFREFESMADQKLQEGNVQEKNFCQPENETVSNQEYKMLTSDLKQPIGQSNTFNNISSKVPNLFASLRNAEMNNSSGSKDIMVCFDLKKIDEVNESQDDNKTNIGISNQNSEANLNKNSSKTLMQVFRGDITCFKEENVIKISNYSLKDEDPSKQTENNKGLFFIKKDPTNNGCHFSSMNFVSDSKQEANLFNKQSDSMLNDTVAANETSYQHNQNDSKDMGLHNNDRKTLNNESMMRDSTTHSNMILVDFNTKIKEQEHLFEDSRTYNIEAGR